MSEVVATCRDCKKVKPLGMFKKGSVSGKTRGKCKQCQAEYSRNAQQERRANNRPEKFCECNDCDRIFYKYTTARGRIELKTCRYCESEDISNYGE